MRDLIKLIEWGFENEGALVTEVDSDSENDRLFKKWKLRAVALFDAELHLFKAISRLNIYNVDEKEARREVEVCTKKVHKAQVALAAAVRHTQTKGSHRGLQALIAHSGTFFFFLVCSFS